MYHQLMRDLVRKFLWGITGNIVMTQEYIGSKPYGPVN